VNGTLPRSLTVTGRKGTAKLALTVAPIDDQGDLRRRWAEGRLAQMIDEGTGHAAMVDLGSRHGIITPVTSLYVPTKNEMSTEERGELERAVANRRSRLLETEKEERSRERATNGRRDGWTRRASTTDRREEAKQA